MTRIVMRRDCGGKHVLELVAHPSSKQVRIGAFRAALKD